MVKGGKRSYKTYKRSHKASRRSKHSTKKRSTKKRNQSMRKYRWSNKAPDGHQRTVMMKKCGSKCFLGPNKTFPICTKNTCKRNQAGVHAAYVRARETRAMYLNRGSRRKADKYSRIANRAKRML